MARSRVELFEQIRKDRRVEGLLDPGTGRPPSCGPGGRCGRRWRRRCRRRGRPARRGPARPSIPYVQVIDGWLVADKDVPRKQRHTARRVWQRLVAEHGATVSEVTVSRHVARRRAELGLDQAEVGCRRSICRAPRLKRISVSSTR